MASTPIFHEQLYFDKPPRPRIPEEKETFKFPVKDSNRSITGITAALDFDACGMVDTLVTGTPSKTLKVNKPDYRSEAGRRSKCRFSDVNMPAPMVYSAKGGLVLYDRVLTMQHEKQVLDKLTKPKFINRRDPEPGTQGQPQGADQRQASSASGARSQSAGHQHPGGAAQPQSARATSSPSQGVGRTAPVQVAMPYHAKSRVFDQQLREREHQESHKYYRGERATMTASNTFTWGGRFKHDPPDRAMSTREGHMVGSGRQPLRL